MFMGYIPQIPSNKKTNHFRSSKFATLTQDPGNSHN